MRLVWSLFSSSEKARQSGGGVRKILSRTTATAGMTAISFCAVGGLHTANAATFYLGDVTITLQSTLGYTGVVRTAPVDNEAISLNTDDGDKNFRSGIVADRFQTLEQLNIQDGNYGLRASALGFLDTVYLQHSKNNSPDTFNSYGGGSQGFPSATVATDGRRVEPLALFLYGHEDFADGTQRLSWQLGRQTITWGEALFSLDGIAGLQAPVDAYQGELLANPQAQALFLPTGAASASYRLGNGLTLAAYWQFEYEPDILPGIGSYFSPADFLGPGGQRLLESTISEGAFSIYRSPDIRPRNGLDQFGFDAHYTVGDYELGAYFVRGIPKAPTFYINATPVFAPTPSGIKVGTYNIVYAEPVNAYAASVSTQFHEANVALEVSGRTNQPLVSSPAVYTVAAPASYTSALYAKGDVIDAQASAIYLTPPLPLFPNGATIETELTANRVLKVTQNRKQLISGDTGTGVGFEGVFSPTYFLRQNLELDLPVGWGTTFVGDSQFDGAETAGAGTIDIGAKLTYRNVWVGGINYQRYYGPPDRQTNIDRDYAEIYLQRTF